MRGRARQLPRRPLRVEVSAGRSGGRPWHHFCRHQARARRRTRHALTSQPCWALTAPPHHSSHHPCLQHCGGLHQWLEAAAQAEHTQPAWRLEATVSLPSVCGGLQMSRWWGLQAAQDWTSGGVCRIFRTGWQHTTQGSRRQTARWHSPRRSLPARPALLAPARQADPQEGGGCVLRTCQQRQLPTLCRQLAGACHRHYTCLHRVHRERPFQSAAWQACRWVQAGERLSCIRLSHCPHDSRACKVYD